MAGAKRRAIGLIAKEPSPGAVKSRLASALGDEPAARLYSAFLRDALLVAARVPGASTSVFHPVSDDPSVMRRLAPSGIEFAPDSGSDLGQIMDGAIAQLLGGGAQATALIGADVPLLTPEDIETAFAVLESAEAEVVLGPSEDGGYYLVAVDAPRPELFTGVDWGGERVFEQTLARASSAGLRVRLLDRGYDVDEIADLTRLAADLMSDGSLAADATRSTLFLLSQEGIVLVNVPRPWTVRGSETAFKSPWRTLVVDEVETHGGDRMEYSYMEAPNAVWVVPVTFEGEIILIRQYRHPIRSWSVEVPAGSGDEGPLLVAERELREEVGGRAKEIRSIGAFYPAAAHLSVRGHVCLALGVEIGESEREPTELLSPFAVPVEIAFDMARKGEISDAQSAIAVLACEVEIRKWLARPF